MNIATAARALPRIVPLTLLCLGLSGCAETPPYAANTTPERYATASRICSDTMGLNPANAPHAECITSLLGNRMTFDNPFPPLDGTPAPSEARVSCAQFGLLPDSEAQAQCAADLDATLFELTYPGPG